MPMSFNPYQQRMPSFRRPPPQTSLEEIFGGGLPPRHRWSVDPRGFKGGSRRPNPFMNRGIGGFGGFGGMFGGRGPRRRPPPRGRFPQSFGGFGNQRRFAQQSGGMPTFPPRRGRGRGGMFGGFPQSRGRGGQSMFGGIGGFGGSRQFNPFMNQFGGGGFNPFMNRFGGGGFNPFARFGGVDPRVGKPTPQEAPAISQEALVKSLPMEMTPMETTAPVMPAAPQPLAPAIPEMSPALPTVGPPGTTITPPAPQDQIDTQPLTRQLGPNVPEGFIPPSGMATQAFVDYWNPTTGETWSAPSGGWTAPEGWERGGPPGSGATQLIPWGGAQQPPPATKPELLPNLVTGELERPTPSPQPLPIGQQPLPRGPQPLLPSMPGKEQRPPPFIGRGPAAPLSPIPPVNVVQENIEREIIPPQLPVAPIGDDMVGYRGGSEGFYDDGKHIFNYDLSLANQTTTPPNTLRVQDREPGFTQADYMRPQMTGTPATAFPSLLPHQQFAPTNLMGEPQKKALRDLLSRGRFGPGGF
jgi:hypothetical protein